MNIGNLINTTLGQYQLSDLLGLGGMGAVYRAYQQNLDREVAVKVLSANLSTQPTYLERFNREARTAAGLEHAHIVPVYDYGTQQGISYVVMRLLQGGSLADRLNHRDITNRPLPSLAEVGSLLTQIAGALDYAHNKGVVHRDIKPSNIMFDEGGDAYLVDFGIAKLTAEMTASLTGAGMTMGTPSYMSPEQWRAEGISGASDQYALAVVVYALLTGKPPFEAPTPYALMHKHLNDKPAPITAQREDLPAEVDSVMARALAKNPQDRYPSVRDFAADFNAAISGAGSETTGFFTTQLPRQRIRMTPTPSVDMSASQSAGRNPWLVRFLVGFILVAIAALIVLVLASGQSNEAALEQTAVALNLTQTAIESGTDPTVIETEASNAQLIVTPTDESAVTEASTATDEPSPTETATASPTETATETVEPSNTPAPIVVVSTPTSTATTTETQTHTATETPTTTPTPSATATATNTPTASPTPSATATETPDIAIVVQTLDAEATSDQATRAALATTVALATENAMSTQAIVDQTATATLWTKTPTPDVTASIDAFRTQQAGTSTQAWVDSWTDTPTPTATATQVTGIAAIELTSPDSESVSVIIEGDPFEGPADALVTIVMFSDYQCPFCKRFHDETYDDIMANYAGQVRFVYVDFPIFGQTSTNAALAAECADDQGKFWDYHDALFARQDEIEQSPFTEIAEDLDLNIDQFSTCMNNRTHQGEIEDDFYAGQILNIMGTPTFWINGRIQSGARPYEFFAGLIDQAIAEANGETMPEATVDPFYAEATAEATPEATIDPFYAEATAEATPETVAPPIDTSGSDIELGQTYTEGINGWGEVQFDYPLGWFTSGTIDADTQVIVTNSDPDTLDVLGSGWVAVILRFDPVDIEQLAEDDDEFLSVILQSTSTQLGDTVTMGDPVEFEINGRAAASVTGQFPVGGTTDNPIFADITIILVRLDTGYATVFGWTPEGDLDNWDATFKAIAGSVEFTAPEVAVVPTEAATRTPLPTLTPTSTPLPPPTDTPMAEASLAYIEPIEGAALRLGPGSTYPLLGFAAQGYGPLEVIGRSSLGDWLLVDVTNARGVVTAQYSEFTEAWIINGTIDIELSNDEIPLATNIPPLPATSETPLFQNGQSIDFTTNRGRARVGAGVNFDQAWGINNISETRSRVDSLAIIGDPVIGPICIDCNPITYGYWYPIRMVSDGGGFVLEGWIWQYNIQLR